jgi:hypothetical protein
VFVTVYTICLYILVIYPFTHLLIYSFAYWFISISYLFALVYSIHRYKYILRIWLCFISAVDVVQTFTPYFSFSLYFLCPFFINPFHRCRDYSSPPSLPYPFSNYQEPHYLPPPVNSTNVDLRSKKKKKKKREGRFWHFICCVSCNMNNEFRVDTVCGTAGNGSFGNGSTYGTTVVDNLPTTTWEWPMRTHRWVQLPITGGLESSAGMHRWRTDGLSCQCGTCGRIVGW